MEYLTYDNSRYSFCTIESFPGYYHATWCNYNLFIVSSSTSKLSTDFLASCWDLSTGRECPSILHNIKLLNSLLSIHKILGILYICTQCIIGVCHTSTMETFLKLEACLSPVIVNYFNLLVIWVLACLV